MNPLQNRNNLAEVGRPQPSAAATGCYLLNLSLLLLFSLTANAQPIDRPPVGAAPLRTEFVPFDTRENAETLDPAKSPLVIPLRDTLFTLPLGWVEREVYLHVEGSACVAWINGRPVGYAEDARTPTEFLVTGYLTEGSNTIRLDADTPCRAYLYAQPKLRIHDFRVTADLADDGAELSVEIITANSFNYSEVVSIGYDIYDPDGKLVYYDRRERTLPGRGNDTIRFNEPISNAQAWSPASPKRYRVMLILWRDGRIIEYIPLHTGFRKHDLEADLATLQNAKPAPWSDYDPAKAKAEMRALKKQGVNLLLPEYPQPIGFYELADELGFWVVDRANIHQEEERENRRVGGTPSNDPALLPAYLYRTEAMYARTKNHPCILARSLGTRSGNGYNMYRTYLLLKQLDPSAPVVYDDAQGEWNSDR